MSSRLASDHEGTECPESALPAGTPGMIHFQAHSIFQARVGHLKKGSTQPTIPIWKLGSELTYTVQLGSFSSCAVADIVGKAIDSAAARWNNLNIGIRFRRALAGERAVFALRCATGLQNVLAMAFFADSDDRTLYVHNLAFLKLSPDAMTRVLLHELGHILGLRHEFAGTDKDECSDPSVALTPDNANSVMNYFADLSFEIQETDVAAVKMLYSDNRPSFDGFEVHVVDPKMLGH